MSDLFDRLKKRMEPDYREIVSVERHDYPMCRYGAMVPDSMSEDGTWAAYAESGPAKGNIVWETEAIPVAILLPGEIVTEESIFAALIEEVQRLREALEDYRDGTCHSCAYDHGAPEQAFDLYDTSDDLRARESLAASDKRLEELVDETHE